MTITRLLLQKFRNYDSADFKFDDGVTYIVGPNTAGKSNLIEAIYLLAQGKSYRAEKDEQMIRLGESIARVKAALSDGKNTTIPEVVLAEPSVTGKAFSKRYFINDIPKRRVDFSSTFQALLFEPSDLDLISGSPSLRREFFDEVLEQTSYDYRHALLTYTKAIRQRNALLQRTKETGIRQDKQFEYWDEILIRTGNQITSARTDFIKYLNSQQKELFPMFLMYDSSIISVERLLQYREAEVASSATLVGPHRDDLGIYMEQSGNRAELLLKSFGSRGQQRLAVLQLKLLQLNYMHEKLSEKPVLLLDDIFSELDEEHIRYILEVVNKQQTIITTTHKEFIGEAKITNPRIIELEK